MAAFLSYVEKRQTSEIRPDVNIIQVIGSNREATLWSNVKKKLYKEAAFDLNLCSNDALTFKYGVWPGKVDILKNTESWRISLGTGDYVQALDPMCRDLHDFSRLDFTVIPADRDTGSVHLLYQVMPVSK